MMFTCTNCKIELELAADEYPFNCACGMKYAAPKTQGFIKKAANFARAAASHVMAGRPKTPPEVYEARLAACNDCQYNQGGLCTMCGCSVTGTGILNKLAWADQACPIGKWGVAYGSSQRVITTAELIADTYTLAQQLPGDITRVVGVARSGLLPASVIAMHLHAELVAFDGRDVVEVGHGWRLTDSKRSGGRTLVVDDSIATGRSYDEAYKMGDAFASVYWNPLSKRRPDYFTHELKLPHYFQWNFANAHYKAAYDFDGVLCQDVTASDEARPGLEKFLLSRPPLYLPRRRPIELVVTARLEKYRQVTLAWLVKHHINVERLVMWQGRPNDRAITKAISEYKAEEYTKTDLQLFIESDPIQAREIAEASGRRVICTGSNEVF